MCYNFTYMEENCRAASAPGLEKYQNMQEKNHNTQSIQRPTDPADRPSRKTGPRRRAYFFLASFIICLVVLAIGIGIWYLLNGGMPGYSRNITLGTQAMEAEDYVRAEEYFTRAVELDGQSVEARLLLIEACEKQEKYERMLVLAKDGTELSPATYEYYECAVRALVRLGRMDEALAFMDSVENNYVKMKIARNRPDDVEFSTEPGTYGEQISLSLTASPDSTIYYTVDGSAPTTASQKYAGPFDLAFGTTVVRAFAISQSGLITEQAEGVFVLRDDDAAYPFKDAKVEQIARAILGLQHDAVTYKQLDKITAFVNTVEGVQGGGSIITLADLLEFRNLDEVRLTGETEITDLEVLTQIDGLTFLSLNSCDIDSAQLKTVSQISTLTSLSLDGNSITDLSPIGQITELNYLSVSDAGLQDLTGLASLTKLKTLVAANNRIIVPKGVSELTSLSTLDLSGNQLSSVSELSPLRRLTELNLSGNRISSLDGIGALTSLRTLDLSSNGLTDIEQLAALRSLDQLDVSRNRIEDFSPLEQTGITYLKATHNALESLDDIASIRSLRTLNVATNMLTKTEPLQKLPSLSELDISNNLISDLSPLADCSALKTLHCSGNPARNTDELAKKGIAIE